MEYINSVDVAQVTKITDIDRANKENRVYLDFGFDKKDNINADSIYTLSAKNDNAKSLIKYFVDYNLSTDKNDSYFTGKLGNVINDGKILKRFNIDKSNISQWINGASKFDLQVGDVTHSIVIRVYGSDVGVNLLFVPYVETFKDHTYDDQKDYHEVTVIGNDPDGQVGDKLTYTFTSSDFRIDQNGSAEAKLYGDRGVFTAVVTDEDGLVSKEVRLVIGSFVSMQSCINSKLGLTDSEQPTAEQLASIKELSCIGSGIESLIGIDKLTNLENLDLTDNKIKDLSLLANLKNLRTLDLSKNLVEDISSLSGLKNLIKLEAKNNKLKDISAISQMNSLSSLNLENNELSALGVLRGLISKFQYLNLNGNYISDLEVKTYGEYNGVEMKQDLMRDFPIVENESLMSVIRSRLNLSPTDEPTIQQYDSITDITIPNSVNDITGIKQLRNLNSVYFNSSKVSDFSELSELPKLTQLTIYSGNETNLTKLPVIQTLEYLNVYGSITKLTDISALSEMTKLTYMRLYEYGWNYLITSLPDLSRLKNLQTFHVNSLANLSDISGLSNVTSLRYVYLEWSSVNNLSALEKNSGLTSLGIYDNQNKLSSVQSIGKLTALHSLSIQGSSITDFSPIANLKELTSLNLNDNSNIKDLSFVKSTKIGYLGLWNLSNLVDISAVSSLKSLYQLQLGSTAITKLSTFASDVALQYVYLNGNNNLTDISSLAFAKNLYSVSYYGYNNSSSFSSIKTGLSKLSTVKSLTIGDYSSTVNSDTNYLDGLALTSLSIYSNTLSNLDGVGRQTALTGLTVSNNGYKTLTSIKPIEKLSALQSLSLQNIDGVTDFSPVSTLTKLSYLYSCSNDGLKTLPSFEKSKASMYQVNLYSNSNLENIDSLSTFANNSNWKSIYVRYSPKIKTVPNLAGMSNISTLSFYDNNISDISSLHNFNYKIGYLDLSYNHISESNLSNLVKDFTDRDILPSSFNYSNQDQ